MAFIKFRAPSLYLDGKKMGTIQTNDTDVEAGDEPQFGDPGLLGYSDGAMQTKISGNGVVPMKGMEVNLIAAMKAKKDFDVAIGIIDGKIIRVQMRCLKAQFKGDHKPGTLAVTCEFGGGEPDQV